MNDQPPLIVLDLNGTILLSQHRRVAYSKEDARTNSKYIYFRPHMHEFLRFLFSHFRVAVWTSNESHNATLTVDAAFTQEQQARLFFVWSRSQCILGPNYTSFKSVARILDTFGPGSVHAQKLTILDDTPSKVCDRMFDQNFLNVLSYDCVDDQDTGLLDAMASLRLMYPLSSE